MSIRGSKISPSTRETISYARNIEQVPLKRLSNTLEIFIFICSSIARHAAKRVKRDELSAKSCYTAPESRSEASSKLYQKELDKMFNLAISSYE